MQVDIPKDFYCSSLAILLLAVGAICALMQRVFPGTKKLIPPAYLQWFFLLGALVASFQEPKFKDYLGGSFVSDPITQISHILILSVSLFISFIFSKHCSREKFFTEESSFLFLTITTGLLIFTSSSDLVTLLVSLEISSLGGYTLLGYMDPNRKSLEGAIKYFILGSVATAFILFGMSFLYAATGSLNIDQMLMKEVSSSNWLRGGFLIFFLGLCFKLALAPFHLWAPDAYEGAPTGVTALLATSFKSAIVILLIRLTPLFSLMGFKLWVLPLTVLIFISVVLGNLMALSQISIKRTLAYSSVAHSAYIALALCSLTQNPETIGTLFFYLISYTLASLVAFGALMMMEREENQNLSLDDVQGFSKKSQWLSFCLTFALISLAGLPPTLGFLGKLFIFKGAIEQNLYFLTVVAILGSTVSLYYYLRIVVHLYMKKEEAETLYPAKPSPKNSYLILGIPLLFALLLGTVLPQKAFDRVQPKRQNSQMAHMP